MLFRVIAVLGALVGTGCVFSGTRIEKARRIAAAEASQKRIDAAKAGDFALALAYDDLLLRAATPDDKQLRADRRDHFAGLVRTKLAELGPLSAETAEVHWNVLLGLRAQKAGKIYKYVEQRYVEVQPSLAKMLDEVDEEATKIRQEDLAAADRDELAPRFEATAAYLWRGVGELEATNAWLGAVARARTLTVQLGPDSQFIAKQKALEERAAAAEEALAAQAGDELPAARVLHARFAAAIRNTPWGATGELTPALRAKTEQNWTISAPGDCGNAGNGDGITPLVELLAKEGFVANPAGAPLALEVTFDSCPASSRTKTEIVQVPYTEKEIIKVEVPNYRTSCVKGKETSDTLKYPDGTITFTTKEPDSCSTYEDGTRLVDREVLVDKTEDVTVNHEISVLRATGKIKITSELGTREKRFELYAESEDDMHWTAVHAVSQSAENGGQGEVRRRMHDLLRKEIRYALIDTLAARAEPDRQRAIAADKAGKRLEADDGFFTEWLIVSPADDNPASVRDYFIGTHHMSFFDMLAAVDERPLPPAGFQNERRFDLPEVKLNIKAESVVSEALNSQVAKTQVMITFGAGPASIKPNGPNAETSYGGGAAFAVFFHKLDSNTVGGMRFGGSVDQHGTGYVDVDGMVGVGIHPVQPLALSIFGGVGGDFTPGGDEDATDKKSLFVAPGVYAEYGARISYAFPRAAAIEANYSKAFRSSTRTAAETRLDGRMVITLPGGFPFAVLARYAEYLPDVTGFFTAFGEKTRTARQGWVLLGVGF